MCFVVHLINGMQKQPYMFPYCLFQALNSLAGVLPNIDDDLDLGLQIAQRVWVVSFDDDDNIRLLAEK